MPVTTHPSTPDRSPVSIPRSNRSDCFGLAKQFQNWSRTLSSPHLIDGNRCPQTTYPAGTYMKPHNNLCSVRRVRVQRRNVPLPYTEFLIPPFGPHGGGQLLNYDIIEFPEEGNPKSSKPEKWEGPNGQHSRAGNSTTEGFEIANANQVHISPLFLHSTAPWFCSCN